MSFERRSSKFSLRSRFSSACSSVVRPRRLPVSTSACFTQDRRDSSPMPSWRATREITVLSRGSCERSSWTIFTARSFNSGGYLFDVGRFSSMTPSSLPRYGVSGDPRPVQSLVERWWNGDLLIRQLLCHQNPFSELGPDGISHKH